ncbi:MULTISPECIES: glycosyltransferase family 4 protein [Paenibacillus]|uniref:glycosyltransferase family 4 protein n=1 Tax=Paenibacillus TaxID=44249 RepID=UPI00087F9B10|nr:MULTISPECIES: glycosyltransferase family 4 protein [Paenibacillus]SDI24291.1 phosphatidylinositol alpha-1,6-mannosyltransferase [Paenibacillus naphthalenovorans]
MKKRLFVSIDFPPEAGGIQNYVHGIISNLNPADSFVLTHTHEKAKEFDHEQTYKIFRTSMKGNKFKNVLVLFKLIIYLIYLKYKIKYDEIHFGNVYPIGLVGPIAKWVLHVDYYCYTHGLDILSLKNTKRTYQSLLFILRHSKKIICNSKYTSEKVKEMGFSNENIVIVQPGIHEKPDVKHNLTEIKDRYDLHNKKVILTVSRLVERKGHDVVLKALKTICRDNPDIRYVICGDGPYRKTLEKIANDYGLNQSVIFTGTLDNDELEGLYLCSNIFIMPSREIKENGDVEGFGIVFLEANYYGLPVIGGNSGGIPEAVLDQTTGFLVDPLNAEEIRVKLKELLTNEALAKQMGENGKKWVVEKCFWKHRVKIIEQLN